MAQVTSGSFTTTSYSGRSITFNWSLASQSIENNTSTINWSFVGSGSATSWFNTRNGYVNIDGARRWTQTSDVQLKNGTTMASGTLTITHNADGKRSFSADGGATIFSYGVYQSGSGSWELPQIPRAATLLTAPNFTDEDNPTITYSNPAGASVTSIQACISNASGTVVYADYRDISKNGTSYTFNLTEEERELLRWATINSPNLVVKFYVTTMIGGKRYESTLDKVMTITNARPILNPTVIDTGASSTKLTGDNSKMIKGFNYMVVNSNATAQKHASIKKQIVKCGNQILGSGSGGFNNIESNVFEFITTDSRGYTTTQLVTKEMIPYIKLSCNLVASNPDTDGNLNFKINGNYFNGSFGATNNTLKVFYRYKENSGEYTDWVEVATARTNDTYDVDVNLTGLNYQSSYTLQAKAVDLVNTYGILSVEKKVRSIPIFDWGKDDFNINGLLTLNGIDAKKVLGGTITATDDNSGNGLAGNIGIEYAKATITPVANTPTSQVVYFKRAYKKPPVVIPVPSTGVIGTAVMGASVIGIAKDYTTICMFRTTNVPTGIHLLIVGEVDE